MMSQRTDRREFLGRIAAVGAGLGLAGTALAASETGKKKGKGKKPAGAKEGGAKEDAGWKPLFNGKDLEGWKEMGGKPGQWSAVDGVLACTGKGGGWISTAQEYANYELSLEFRLPVGGNSGVFLRHPGPGDGAYSGMEIQVLDDYAKEYNNLRPYQYCGSLYGVQAAAPGIPKSDPKWKDRASLPPDASGKTPWEKMELVCNGRKVKITLNGKVVVDANLDDYPNDFAKHPGLKRTTGFIGLQNHSTGVEYRNLKIKELPVK